MKRIFFDKYDSSGKFPDSRVKLDVHFKDSQGEHYVWTPDWEKGTRHFFLEAYRIESLNIPKSLQKEKFKKVAEEVLYEETKEELKTNYKLLAMKLGQAVIGETTINEINRVASAIFEFHVVEHPQDSITVRRQGKWDS